jgi:hypothetical protein
LPGTARRDRAARARCHARARSGPMG